MERNVFVEYMNLMDLKVLCTGERRRKSHHRTFPIQTSSPEDFFFTNFAYLNFRLR